MKSFIKSSAIAFSLFAATVAHASPQKLVTIVTSPEAQTQLMAMVLTFQAVQQGAQKMAARLLADDTRIMSF